MRGMQEKIVNKFVPPQHDDSNMFTQRTLRVYSLALNHNVLYQCEVEQDMQEP